MRIFLDKDNIVMDKRVRKNIGIGDKPQEEEQNNNHFYGYVGIQSFSDL